MRCPIRSHRFLAFFPPYQTLSPLMDPGRVPSGKFPIRGAALIWNLQAGDWGSGFRAVRDRPPGMALLLLLPPASEIEGTAKLLQLMEHCRPHSVLPHLEEVDPEDLIPVLRRFPSDLGMEVTEYLRWRGIETDLDTRRLIRKTLELSADLRTVSGLARGLYLSRRALGRRFMSRGLPVPSHWLHFGRTLRACLALQAGGRSLHTVASSLGYPDGFSLSNQMKRLMNLRPSMMRELFGWEWIVESWLFQEARVEGFSPMLRRHLFPELTVPGHSGSGDAGEGNGPDVRRMSVAEPRTDRRRKNSSLKA